MSYTKIQIIHVKRVQSLQQQVHDSLQQQT
jgi:hypothetical protein